MLFLRLEFLGTGTSFGVPEIGCNCAVCTSPDPRDRRWRSSIWVAHDDASLVVDATPDFREQCLRSRLPRLDALLLTHLHADHIFGLDDVRKYNYLQQMAMPVHLPPQYEARFRAIFHYALAEPPPGLTRPRFDVLPLDGAPLRFGDLEVQPVAVEHGAETIAGYLFSAHGWRCAYLTDCKELPPATKAAVHGVDVLILGALWDLPRRHAGHLNLAEALELAAELAPRQTYLTHLTHMMGRHAETQARLPPGVALAHDGLVVTAPAPNGR
jgi:phosphoribosyl 1,2-cyclic phosphate phosphodiesterase